MDEMGEGFHLRHIFFACVRPAATPHFIAQAEIAQLVRSLAPICRALFGGRGRRWCSHIFKPFGSVLHCARTDVNRNIGFGTNLFGKVHEFMRTERVGFRHACPDMVDGCFAFGANAVAPVIFIGKATAGPTHNGDLDGLECANNIAANTAHIRDFAILANPDAAVNAGAQMLGKLAENVAVDGCAGLVRFDSQWTGLCLHLCHRRSHGLCVGLS